MLIDQILSNPILVKAGMLTTDLRGRLSRVHKFALDRGFAMAADEFSTDIDNVNKALPLARLPFNECWFEVAQADRRFFASAPFEPGDGKVSRVGFLCTLLNHQGSWSAQLFWSFAASETFIGHLLPPSLSGYMLIVDPHQSDVLEATSFDEASGLQPFYRQLSSMDDWIGESGFLIATLALLNWRNTAEVQPVKAANKRRRLLGKPLLFDYSLISIPHRYQQRHHLNDSTNPTQFRQHWCKGHFKARKTGIFWWSDHLRGDPKHGFAHRDYKLRLPEEVVA